MHGVSRIDPAEATSSLGVQHSPSTAAEREHWISVHSLMQPVSHPSFNVSPIVWLPSNPERMNSGSMSGLSGTITLMVTDIVLIAPGKRVLCPMLLYTKRILSTRNGSKMPSLRVSVSIFFALILIRLKDSIITSLASWALAGFTTSIENSYCSSHLQAAVHFRPVNAHGQEPPEGAHAVVSEARQMVRASPFHRPWPSLVPASASSGVGAIWLHSVGGSPPSSV